MAGAPLRGSPDQVGSPSRLNVCAKAHKVRDAEHYRHTPAISRSLAGYAVSAKRKALPRRLLPLDRVAKGNTATDTRLSKKYYVFEGSKSGLQK